MFVVNGTTLEGFPKGRNRPATCRNKHDGTFEDVTAKAGLALTGWGQGACAGDYDNDGNEDLFVTFFGTNRLFRNRGDGTFDDVTKRAGLDTVRSRWGAAARSSTTTATAASISSRPTTSISISRRRLCPSRGCAAPRLPVACGPPGLPGGKNILYRNG